MKKPFTCLAIVFLSLVGLAHLVRVVMGVEITIGDLVLPVWPSALAAIFCLGIAFLTGRETRK